jgi:photosystem II stability/assembly factor-like uncharacterized protein
MSNSRIGVTASSMCLLVVLCHWGCKKSDDIVATSNGSYQIYELAGTIGAGGGKVQVTNANSSINGAFVEVPAGALNSNVDISIVITPANIVPPIDSTATLIRFQPAGVTFNSPVKIGLPYRSSLTNLNEVKAFYYSRETSEVRELIVDSIDSHNHIVVTQTEHFSDFFAGSSSVGMSINMINMGGNAVGARVSVFGKSNGTNIGLYGIPTDVLFLAAAGYGNAGDVCENYFPSSGSLYSIFVLRLKETKLLLPDVIVAKQTLYVKRVGVGVVNGQSLAAYRGGESDGFYFTDMLYSTSVLDNWYSGLPFVFMFKNVSLDASKKYYVSAEWALASDPNASFVSRMTPIYEYNNYSDRKQPASFQPYANDVDGNQIDDNFQSLSQTPPAPVLSSPSNGSAGVATNPILTWNASSGATSYRLQVSTSSAFPSTAFDQSGISATSQQVSGLSSNVTYYWRVNATNTAGPSAWSSPVWGFTTASAVQIPPVPVLVSPTNGTTGVATNPTLAWNASSGATSYRLQVSTSSTFPSTVFDQSGISATSQQVSGLSSNVTYYWRVNATNAAGPSAWSFPVWGFKTTSGQSGWYSMSTGLTGQMNDVFFVDLNTGWIVGENGLLMKTTNGGTEWSPQPSGTPDRLLQVQFINANTGWTAGGHGGNDGGSMLKTTDGGVAWIQNYTGMSTEVEGFYFLDATHGWAVDYSGGIQRTTNGGSSWASLTSPTPRRLLRIGFADLSNGYICGSSGTTFKTTNGGISWEWKNSHNLDKWLSDIAVIDAQTAIIVGESGTILRTSNGGDTWSTPICPTAETLTRVRFVNSSTGYASGYAGVIIKTSDGGITWTVQKSNVSSILTSVFFINTSVGWAVGENGTLLKTSTGGN